MKKLFWLLGGAVASVLAALVCLLCRAQGAALILMLICLVLLGLTLFFAVRESRVQAFLVRETKELQVKARDVERLRGLERKQVQSELSVLQFQINPHFLYNTLDTIRAHALINDQEQIARMAEKLSRFFRYAISNRQPLVKLEDELRHVEDYLYIQRERFGDRFEAEMVLEDEALADLYVLKLLLQPLVENAITHGLEGLRRQGRIRIEIAAMQNKLLLKVADNGSGMSEERLAELNQSLQGDAQMLPRSSKGKHNGIAVHNVNARIRLTFGADYGLHYRSMEGEGTIATITLPLIDDFARRRFEEEA